MGNVCRCKKRRLIDDSDSDSDSESDPFFDEKNLFGISKLKNEIRNMRNLKSVGNIDKWAFSCVDMNAIVIITDTLFENFIKRFDEEFSSDLYLDSMYTWDDKIFEIKMYKCQKDQIILQNIFSIRMQEFVS